MFTFSIYSVSSFYDAIGVINSHTTVQRKKTYPLGKPSVPKNLVEYVYWYCQLVSEKHTNGIRTYFI